MRNKIIHLLKGATLVGAAAFIGAVVGDVSVLGLDPTTAALITGVLKAIEGWLSSEAGTDI